MRYWIEIGLNVAVALTALLAAAFWYQSARNPLPPMATYWDAAPEDDPLYAALRKGTLLNKPAAIWAATSAIFTAFSAVLPLAWH